MADRAGGGADLPRFIATVVRRRALAEQPKATWLHRFLAPASVPGGDRDGAQQSLHALAGHFPELTISQVMAGLPHTPRFLDRVAEGLAVLGTPRS